jgi:hypothetical protein
MVLLGLEHEGDVFIAELLRYEVRHVQHVACRLVVDVICVIDYDPYPFCDIACIMLWCLRDDACANRLEHELVHIRIVLTSLTDLALCKLGVA